MFIPPEIKTEILPIARIHRKSSPTKIYRFTGTPGEFLSLMASMSKTNGKLSRGLSERTGSWSGLGSETGLDATMAGYSQNALKAFESASAALGPSKARGTPQLSNQGPAFSMARVIQGHPVASFKRPKTKLPPVSLDLTVNAWCGRKPEDIQNALAKIARAVWDYQVAGGPVSLTVHHLYHFTQARDGHWGFMASLKIPLSNGSQFATGASLQMFRGLAMPLASTLSGDPGDGLPLATWDNPKTLPISGEPSEDAAILAKLAIV